MSAAVESQSQPALNGLLNGHRVEQNGTNGHHDTRPWDQQFLPTALRLDDKIRAQKVRHVYLWASPGVDPPEDRVLPDLASQRT